MAIYYVNEFKSSLRSEKDGGRPVANLIWGDPVHVIEEAGDFVKVQAREKFSGWLKRSELSNKGLLEIYVIDVGQGDGILMKTPDDKWHLIDAGVPGKDQMTQKGAANFLRWKFIEDLKRDKVSLANVIVTHPDYDHYGGLFDVLKGELFDGRKFNIEVENFYHNGIGRFNSAPKLGKYVEGEVGPFPGEYHGIQRKGSFITELLDGKDSFETPPRAFEDSFAELAKLAVKVPKKVSRLSHKSGFCGFLPGYAPGGNDVTIHVLGPVLENFSNNVGLRKFENDSKTVNGHSIVLRLDYVNARILLTGDLNAKSHELLLSYHHQDEFTADVAKGCHHGAEDIYLDFIKAVKARATVISSGDNEDYSHPRPVLLGASARYGREAVGCDGELMAPLLYSTELARSVKLDYASKARVDVDRDPASPSKEFYPKYIDVKPGGSSAKFRSLKYTPISTNLVYGLVNIRTDGTHILCATMEEKGNDFDVKVFKAGVEP